MTDIKKIWIRNIVTCLLILIYTKTFGIHPPIETFSQQQCIAANIFFEARAESIRGMQAVAAVVYNRMQTSNYPESACGVIFQRKQFSWTHQENQDKILAVLRGETSKMQPKDALRYKIGVDIAQRPKVYFLKLLPRSVTHYHSVKVKPKWSAKMKQVAKIGNHVFYARSNRAS